MRSRPAAPSSPRLTVLLLPLLSTCKRKTLQNSPAVNGVNRYLHLSRLYTFLPCAPFPLPRRHGVTFSSRFMMARPSECMIQLSTPVCSGREKCYLLLTFFFLLPAAWVTLGFLFSGLSSTAILLNFRFLLLFARNS